MDLQVTRALELESCGRLARLAVTDPQRVEVLKSGVLGPSHSNIPYMSHGACFWQPPRIHSYHVAVRRHNNYTHQTLAHKHVAQIELLNHHCMGVAKNQRHLLRVKKATPKQDSQPAPPNYPLRDPIYHLIETIRPLIEVHWGV